MTDTQISAFKALFSNYCHEQVNQCHCDDNDCEFCPINYAYNKIFDEVDVTNDEEDEEDE